jgi:hypothetical protein
MKGLVIQDSTGVTYFEAANGAVGVTGDLDVVGAVTVDGTFALNTSNLGTEGYNELPNGMIIKWGSMGSMALDTIETTTFGASHGGAFPHAVFGAVASAVNASGSNPTLDLASLSTTAIGLNNRGYAADNTYWFAWGY